MKERVKKEMELLLWDICLINEDVEAVSRGIVVIKIYGEIGFVLQNELS